MKIKTILDIGCGVGTLTNKLSQKFPDASILGIDNNQVMLEKARQLKNKKIKFQELDILQLESLQNREYDLIVMNNVLYILENKKKVLENISKLLSGRGIFIFSDPKPPKEYKYLDIVKQQFGNLQSFTKSLRLLPSLLYIYYFNRKIDKSYRRLSRNQYEKIIEEVGFKILDVRNSYAKQANMFILTKLS